MRKAHYLAQFYAILALSTLTAVGPFSAHAAPPHIPATAVHPACKAEAVQDPRIAGRAQFVTFPDGRSVTVVGHAHGNRDIVNLASANEIGRLTAMNDSQFELVIRNIAKAAAKDITVESRGGGLGLKDVSATNHARQDYAYLNHLIRRQRLHFIGFEASHADVVAMIPMLARARSAILNDFDRRARHGGLRITRENLVDTLLVGKTANFYLFAENPELARVVKPMGFEDPVASSQDRLDVVSQASFDAMNALIREAGAIPNYQTLRQDPQYIRFAHTLDNFFNAGLYMRVDLLDNFKAQADQLLELAPFSLRPSVRNVIDATRARIENGRIRDHAVAHNLAKARGTGVHFAGAIHLTSTIRYLEEICTGEMGQGRPTLTGGSQPASSGGMR